MNTVEIKNYLRENTDKLIEIMESLGFTDINDATNGFRCSPPDHYSPNGVSLTLDGLFIKSFTTSYFNFKGDLIECVKYIKDVSFTGAMKYIHDCCGLTYNARESAQSVLEKDLFFGGFFEMLDLDLSDDNIPKALPLLDESILNNYTPCFAERFQRDGISALVQRRYGIHFDDKSNRIVVPWRDWESGALIGLMGRINRTLENGSKTAKWLPVDNYSFEKKHTIYGFYENKNNIIETGTMFVGESEKFPMQLSSMEKMFADDKTGEISYKGLDNGTALGSHNLSPMQVSIIHSIQPKNIILCLDEDVPEKELIEMCKMLKSDSLIYSNNVGYIKDREGKYLEIGSKLAPTDKGRKVFEELIKNCLFWI